MMQNAIELSMEEMTGAKTGQSSLQVVFGSSPIASGHKQHSSLPLVPGRFNKSPFRAVMPIAKYTLLFSP